MAEDNHVYGFSRTDADALIENIGTTQPVPTYTNDASQGRWICKAPGGGIAARSGATVSSASCTVQYISGTTLTASTLTVPVFNLSLTAVSANAYIVAVFAGGVLVAVWEDC